jgi:hypothetical protein
MDIRGLATLVATAQKQNDRWADPREIDAISGSIIDPEFMHSFAERFTVTEITGCHAGNANVDPRASSLIIQIRQPLAHDVDARLRDEATHLDHYHIVTYKLQKGKRVFPPHGLGPQYGPGARPIACITVI